ncbi:helix-turn-helix domain containing protein [Solwaraspora sp. WMMD1047]|uniref:TetR/AcrR family transcriptional regulator n=1 Tax=Solwaraspora sp. WMMD1047 TaxID=3016102 RepID=UPI002416BCFE|nr:TetR/AcrR family transcriptional regulator [Solwaraspora sp. WMMD1047]MDG4833156.1 helix-turn-helix domain containing protein [Solwaraspora sp. WMMD1047]
MTSGTPGNTRSRIQAIALELFTEQGYEKTSLREIAERLGVTKAALYYHFKSKDDIVNSFVSDRISRLDELVKWAEDQPLDAAGRRAVLRRYADELFGDEHHTVMQFFEQNQTVLKSLAAGQMMRERLMRIASLLAGPDAAPTAQVRAAMAIFAVHSSLFAIRDSAVSLAERRRIALEIGDELLDRVPDPPR